MNRIGLMDKHELFRASLKHLINNFDDCSVEMESSSLIELENKMYPGSISILIIDIIKMSDTEWEVLKRIKHHFPDIRLVVLTNLISKEIVLRLIEAGISGCYSKEISALDLENAIYAVVNSQDTFDVKFGPVVREKLVCDDVFKVNMKNKFNVEFSDREREVLRLVCQEMTNVEISQRLDLSVRTVESHRRRMIEKTDSRTIIGVLVYAVKENISLDFIGREVHAS